MTVFICGGCGESAPAIESMQGGKKQLFRPKNWTSVTLTRESVPMKNTVLCPDCTVKIEAITDAPRPVAAPEGD